MGVSPIVSVVSPETTEIVKSYSALESDENNKIVNNAKAKITLNLMNPILTLPLYAYRSSNIDQTCLFPLESTQVHDFSDNLPKIHDYLTDI